MTGGSPSSRCAVRSVVGSLAGTLVLLACGAAPAATLTLSVGSPSAGQWQVFGSLNTASDNDGLASLVIDVTAWGELSVGSSLNRLPSGTHYWLNGQTVTSQQVGFTEFRSDGTAGIGIRAGQRTVAADKIVLEEVGYIWGSYPGDTTGQGLGPTSISWAAPVLVASGTFSGGWGQLLVNVGDGQINVLDQNRPVGATGMVHEVESVAGGVFSLYHAGDFSGDWAVDVGDLGILAASWGHTGPGLLADGNDDLVVDVGDLGILALNWGWAAAGEAMLAHERLFVVPAPGAIIPLLIGAVALLRRRRLS